MKPDERRERITNLVREASKVSVDELASLLDTSRETVRRDLTLLSEQGLLRKVHGGAVYTQTAIPPSSSRWATGGRWPGPKRSRSPGPPPPCSARATAC